MNNKAKETVKKFNMLKEGDTVLVALSGGADSVALLRFLKETEKEYGLRVYACHLNHMIRGAEAERDEKFCEELCEKLGVQLFIKRADIPKISEETKQSLELCGREERYRFFAETIEKLGGGKIALAHNLNDLAETMFFNITRGTSIIGVASIPPVRDNVVRPLLYCPRLDIENYLEKLKQDFVTDSTNLEDVYTRNIFRHKIVSVLQEINPQLLEHIETLSKAAAEDEELLKALSVKALEEARLDGDGYAIEKLSSLAPSLLKRALRAFLEKEGFEISARLIEEVAEIVLKGQGKINVSCDRFVVCRSGCLKTERLAEKIPFWSMDISLGDNSFFTKILRLSYLSIIDYRSALGYNKKSGEKKEFLALDASKAAGKLTVRKRMEGDKIRIADRNLSKSIKKLFSEKKIPLEKRDKMPVVLCDGKIAGIIGVCADESFKIENETKNVLILEII